MKIKIIICLLLSVCFVNAQYSLFGMKEKFADNDFYLEFLMKSREYEKVEQLTEWMIKQNVERFEKGPFARDLRAKNESLYWQISSLKNGNNSVVKEIKDQIHQQPNTYYSNVASFYLAAYYFLNHDFNECLTYYELVNPIYFTNTEWVELTFNKAYCYFILGNLDLASRLFKVVLEIRQNAYKDYAIYYQSLIDFKEKEYQKALEGFLKIQDKKPYNTIVPMYILYLYNLLNEPKKAFDYGLKIPIAQIDSTLVVIFKNTMGYISFSLKKYKYTIDYFKDNLTIPYQNNDRIFAYELGYAYLMLYEKDSCINILQLLSAERDSIGIESLYLLTNIYIQNKEKEKARQVLGSFMSLIQDSAKRNLADFTYAKLLLDLGYQNEAIMALENIAEQATNPYSEEAKDWLAQAITLSADYKKAYFLLMRIKNPSSSLKKMIPDIKYGYAMQLIKEKDYNTADSLLHNSELSQNLNPYQPFTFFWEGDIATYQRKPENAIFYYNKYLQMGSPAYGEANKMNALFGLGTAYMLREEYHQSIKYFLQVIKPPVTVYSPDIEKEAYLNLADCYLMLKQYDTAQKIYKIIYSKEIIAPDYAYYKLSQIVGIKNQDLKERMLADFESLYPNSYYKEKAKYEQILTLMNQFKFEKAIDLIKSAIGSNLLPNIEDELYAQLGLCYYSLNHMDSASQVYTDLIQKFPNSDYSSEALTNLKTIYVQQEKIQEYINLLNRLNINIDDREKDSLLYATTQVDINKASASKRIALMENYLSNYPNGIYASKVNLMVAELLESNKQFRQAATHYLEIINKRPNPFVEVALYKYARIIYFDFKQYDTAAIYYTMLANTTSIPDYEKEALRALLRCYYFTKKWDSAQGIANRLVQYPTLAQDDKSLIAFVNGKFYYESVDYTRAIHYFELVDDNSLYYQDASLDLINSYYLVKNYDSAQTKALDFVKSKYANDPYIITKVYLLLGDIFKDQGDVFNARATYESIVERGQDSSLIETAKERLILMSAIKNEEVKPTPIPVNKKQKKK